MQVVGSSPRQLPPSDVTGALREAILLRRLPGESARPPPWPECPCFRDPQLTSCNFQRGEGASQDGDQGRRVRLPFQRWNPGSTQFQVMCSAAPVSHTCPTKFCQPQNMAIASYQVQ